MMHEPRRVTWLLVLGIAILLTVVVTVISVAPAALSTLPAAPERAVSWSPLVTAGESEGPETSTLGLVGDAALDDDGRMVVLDVAAKRVGVFDRHGSVVRSLGREGRGPGEFIGPMALALRNGGRLYVLDRINRRVEMFEVDSGARIGSFQVLLSAEDLCFVGDRLFLLGALGGKLIHEVSPSDGEILRSFAPDQDSSDPLLSSYRAGGYLACGPGDEVTFLPLLRPEVARFRASTGLPLGTAVLPGYRAVQVRRLENGAVSFVAPDGSSHDYASSIVPLADGDQLVQVGVIRDGATTRHEFESLRSFILSWRNRTVRTSPEELPRVMYTRNDTALAAFSSPHPTVWMIGLHSVAKEHPDE